jgi:hypothetical protein
MIRIEISAAAYAALTDGVPEHSRLPFQPSPLNGFEIPAPAHGECWVRAKTRI